MKLSLVLILLSFIFGCNGGKILVLVPFNGPSHWHYFSGFIKEFLKRGHEVTAITGINMKAPLHANYSEVFIDPPFNFDNYVSKEDIFDVKIASPIDTIKWMYWLGLNNVEDSLKSKNVQEFIKREDLHFDLIVTEQEMQESFLMFGHKFKAPIVSMATLGSYSDVMDYANGLITPYSYCPHMFLDYSDKMDFWERLNNVYISLYDRLYRYFWYMPEQSRIANKYFEHLKKNGPLPSLEDLEKSIALFTVNTHEILSKPRPKMPNEINIGAATLRPDLKKIPADMKKFMDEAEHGVVYMSLGAFVQSSAMPRATMEGILRTFGRLQQRVIWKFESDSSITSLPSNVMLASWLPQSDILAHPNIRLFITHGGMHGTTEGMYNGLPMLFIPFYGDQHRNAKKAVDAGVALTIQFKDITAQSFSAKVNTLLTDDKYYKKAQEISRIFKDSPMDPMEHAMYHIEFVMRHNGAKHLKSAAIELTWYQNLLLDIVGFILLLLFVALMLVKVVLKLLMKQICKTSNNDNSNHNKKKRKTQ